METSPPIFASKVCSTCGLSKPINEFHKANGYRDGYTGQCKICRQKVIAVWKKARVPKSPPPDFQRECRDCGKMVGANDLVKDKGRKYGLSYWCHACWAKQRKQYRDATDPEIRNRYQVKYRKRNYATVLDRHVRRVYNITIEDYLSLLDSQDGVCKLCGELNLWADGRLKPLQVDHCHDGDEEVRGLLCSRCNTSLGSIGDDPEWLGRAAEYVNNRGKINNAHLALALSSLCLC